MYFNLKCAVAAVFLTGEKYFFFFELKSSSFAILHWFVDVFYRVLPLLASRHDELWQFFVIHAGRACVCWLNFRPDPTHIYFLNTSVRNELRLWSVRDGCLVSNIVPVFFEPEESLWNSMIFLLSCFRRSRIVNKMKFYTQVSVIVQISYL